jgi:hypothetical protein
LALLAKEVADLTKATTSFFVSPTLDLRTLLVWLKHFSMASNKLVLIARNLASSVATSVLQESPVGDQQVILEGHLLPLYYLVHEHQGN